MAWPSLLVGVLAVLAIGFASQYFALAFGKRAKSFFVLFIFFAWAVPIIIGAIVRSSGVEEALYLIALSPIVGIVTAGGINFPGIDHNVLTIASIAPSALCSVCFFALALGEERQLRHRISEEPSGKRRRARVSR